MKWKRNRSSHDLKMADRDSVRTSQEKDLRYNVEVAKRMTVPDEIRLTGPSRAAVDSSKPSSSSSQSNYHLPTQQLAPTAPDLETNQDRAPLDKNEWVLVASTRLDSLSPLLWRTEMFIRTYLHTLFFPLTSVYFSVISAWGCIPKCVVAHATL